MKTFWKKIGWAVTALLLAPEGVFAACTQTVTNTTQTVTNTSGTVRLDNPIRAQTFQDLADEVLTVVSSVGGILAVFFIIYSGFLFVTAGGSEEKRKSAKWTLLYAIIGTAVLVGARALATIICTTVESLQ